MKIPARWVVVSIFLISSALNYLDRQILAALAPAIKAEFGLNNEDFGYILSLFSVTYAISSPLAGLFLDRVGLSVGMSIAVAVWSVAAMARGFVTGLPGLMAATAVLGVGESAGIPSTGKAGAVYLEPKERAMGAGLSQIGLSIGSILAPLIAAYFMKNFGWRWAFIVPGAIGFLWIPLWLSFANKAPRQPVAAGPPIEIRSLLTDRQMIGFVGGNILAMAIYSLWTNWTTVFLTTQFGLPAAEANRLAPVPHFVAYFGALGGGAISYRLIARGMEPLRARRRTLLICALAMLTTALVPRMPTPLTATLMISVSFFFASGWGVNYYTMPVDAYGSRAAFAVSLLTMAYGILQIFVSPLIGRTIDQFGFGPVCLVAAITPLLALGVVELTRKR
jgi:ACS family hexuronate transporter-like MFS transporter